MHFLFLKNEDNFMIIYSFSNNPKLLNKEFKNINICKIQEYNIKLIIN